MFRALLALALLAALPACRGDAAVGDLAGYRVDVAIAPTPPLVGDNRVVLTLRDPDGAPVTGARVTLEGTMTHAGMVPVEADGTPEGSGRYRVDPFPFTMAGDWILLVHVTLADGRGGTLRRETRVVAGPSGG